MPNPIYPYGYNNSFNPSNNMLNYNSQPKLDLIKVEGVQGVKSYQTPPDSNVPMFDANQDILYIKTTDSAGFCKNILGFSITPIELESSDSQYVSAKEFKELKEVIENYGKQIISIFGGAAGETDNSK